MSRVLWGRLICQAT